MNTDTLIILISERLKSMTPEDRLRTLQIIFAGYCQHCGCKDLDNNCQCWNDE